MGSKYQFRKNHCFFLSFVSKSRTIILSSGRLILIKNSVTTRKTDFSSKRNLLQKLSLLMRVKHYCVLQKQVVKSKTLFQLTQSKFLANENHSLQFSQIPYRENTFLNEYFIPASGNLLSVQWKHHTFVQSIFVVS